MDSLKMMIIIKETVKNYQHILKNQLMKVKEKFISDKSRNIKNFKEYLNDDVYK